MYLRRIKCRNQIRRAFQPSKYWSRPSCVNGGFSQYSIGRVVSGDKFTQNSSLVRGHLTSRSIASTCNRNLVNGAQLRAYSSEGDGKSASGNDHVPVKEEISFGKGKSCQEAAKEGAGNSDAHARLGEQDQREWLANEKLSAEGRKKESPFLTRREKFKNEFLRRVIPWEKITVSWDTFPYFFQ